MENQEKINFKKIYKSNKKQMIKTEKGKIVGLDLIANIKDLKTDFIFNLEIEFNQDTSIQKMIANQGILLPYKFLCNIKREYYKEAPNGHIARHHSRSF